MGLGCRSLGSLNRNSSSAADRSYYLSTYIYSASNRLTQAVQPDPVDPLQQLTESFAYDPVGNRTSSHLATGQIHDAGNRLLEDSTFTFSYDANGNLIEQITKANGDRTVYTYNVENQLIRVEKFTIAGGLNPVLVAVYRYDVLARRIAKEVTQAGITTITRYVYDNEDILLELDGANVVQARYTHGPGIDEPLIMLRGTQAFFYHADGLGSIWDLTDSTGLAARSHTYDSFGQLIAQTGTVPNPYTYTSREFDPETGLYYYRARYYDPKIGRFLQEDPVEFQSGINFYNYALNNPVTLVDPLGLFPLTSIDAAIQVCLRQPTFAKREACLLALLQVLNPEAQRRCLAALEKVRMLRNTTAQDFIAKNKQARILRQFPTEFLTETLEKIEMLAKRGVRAAQTAWKLLNDKRFNK